MTLLIDANNLMYRELFNLGGGKITNTHPVRDLWIKYGTASDLVVFVWDGFDGNKRRRDIFPDYKMNRPEKGEDVYAIIKMFQDLLLKTPCMQIKVPTWEADDVIYTLAHFFAQSGDQVQINTNDADYLQIDLPGVTLPFISKWAYDPYLIKAYKALVGDSADNIPGLPRFGEGCWKNCRDEHAMIDEALRTNNWDLWQTLNFPRLVQKSCFDKNNFDKSVLYYKVVTMQDVPLEDIGLHSITGQYDPRAAEELLRQFMI